MPEEREGDMQAPAGMPAQLTWLGRVAQWWQRMPWPIFCLLLLGGIVHLTMSLEKLHEARMQDRKDWEKERQADKDQVIGAQSRTLELQDSIIQYKERELRGMRP